MHGDQKTNTQHKAHTKHERIDERKKEVGRLSAYQKNGGKEVARTVFHLLTPFIVGSLLILCTYMGVGGWGLLAAWLVVTATEYARHWFRVVQIAVLWTLDRLVITRLVLWAMRKDERDEETRAISGVLPIGTALGINYTLVVNGYLLPERFVLVLFYLAFTDPAAKQVGLRFGKTCLPTWLERWANGNKSVEGFLGAFAVGLSIALTYKYYFQYTLGMETAIVVSFAAAFVELLGKNPPWWRDDNLFIPLAVGALLTLLP